MKRRTAVSAALLALAGPGGAQSPARAPKTGAGSSADGESFVSVDGGRFVRHGRPYYVAGANLWYGGYLGAPDGLARRERLVKELDSLRALDINNSTGVYV